MRPDWPAPVARNPVEMLHTLNALAAKLSPTQTQNVDGDASRIALAAAATSLTTANGGSTSSNNGYTLIFFFSNLPTDGYRTTDRRKWRGRRTGTVWSETRYRRTSAAPR